jgi:hypothetical protein
VLVLHDTTEFIYRREENVAIGMVSKQQMQYGSRPRYHTMRGRTVEILEVAVARFYSQSAECVVCQSLLPKTKMIYASGYGWFCNEDERDEYWKDHLI